MANSNAICHHRSFRFRLTECERIRISPWRGYLDFTAFKSREWFRNSSLAAVAAQDDALHQTKKHQSRHAESRDEANIWTFPGFCPFTPRHIVRRYHAFEESDSKVHFYCHRACDDKASTLTRIQVEAERDAAKPRNG